MIRCWNWPDDQYGGIATGIPGRGGQQVEIDVGLELTRLVRWDCDLPAITQWSTSPSPQSLELTRSVRWDCDYEVEIMLRLPGSVLLELTRSVRWDCDYCFEQSLFLGVSIGALELTSE